jgi:hypothetical protein
MKILSPRAHGYVDYLVVAWFLAGPSVFGLAGLAATIAYALAVVHLLMTIATNFPMGLLKLIPFPLHGLIEVGIAVLLFALPWMAGFYGDATAKDFYVGAGAGVLVVFLISDYTAGLVPRR